MKMKFISQRKSFYGFCLIKVYKLTFSSFFSCGSIVYPVKSTNYNSVACSQTLYFLGGYSWEFLVGVCRPVLQILTLFQTKKCNSPHSFSTRPLKSILVLAFRQNLCHHYLDQSANKLKILRYISNSHIFRSFLLIWSLLKR